MRMLVAQVIFVLALASASHAGAIPALQPTPIPDVPVLGEKSQPTSLRAVLQETGSGPVVLLPIFTRCSGSCPTLTRKLEAGLAAMKSSKPYRVVVISFDPLETDESLRLYRARERMPVDWMLVRTQGNDIQGFLNFFRYSVMNEEGTLVHPSEIFLLDGGLTWRWTLAGESWTQQELATAMERTRAPGLSAWLQAHPERLAWTGFAGLIVSMGVAVGWMLAGKPSPQVAEA